APGAGVEDPLDVFDVVPRHARQWHAAIGGDDGEHLRGCCEARWSMLQFDGQPVEAGLAHQVRGYRIGEREPSVDGRDAAFELVADGVRFHGDEVTEIPGSK